MIIRNLVNATVSKLRGRTDLKPVLPYYIAVAILELTQNIQTEDLEVTGPLTNFIPNQAEYSVKDNPFINSQDIALTFIKSWFVYFATNGQVVQGQTTGKEIDERDIRVVEPLSKVLGIPSIFTLHGDKKNNGRIIVGQMPDNPYPCQMRYQRQHPFNIPYGQVLDAINDSTLCNMLAESQVYMRDDWSDIIVYAAAEKACDDNGLTEIGQLYHQKLFGYKDKKGNDMPGLIMAKQTQQERNTIFNSRAMRPIVRRYC